MHTQSGGSPRNVRTKEITMRRVTTLSLGLLASAPGLLAVHAPAAEPGPPGHDRAASLPPVHAGGLWSPPTTGGSPDSCYPDCNLDGALTIADFGCFQSAF